MKKIFIIISISCTLILCACGNNESENKENNNYEENIEEGAINKMEDFSEKDSQMYLVKKAYASVLQNEEIFYCTDNIPYENITSIHEYNGYLKEMTYSEDKTLVTLNFGVVDLDGDGIPEVVLEIEDYYGYIILRYIDGKIKGNIIGYRTMNHLKKNGNFISSSGSDNNSWGNIFFVNNTFVKEEMLAQIDDSYYERDIPIDKDLWKKADTIFSKFEDVEWQELSSESINQWIISNQIFTDLDEERRNRNEEKKNYLNTLSYLLNLTYDYTIKSQDEINRDGKIYYESCIEEMDKILQSCLTELSGEKVEEVINNQKQWQESIDYRLKSELNHFEVSSIEDLENQSLYYTYGDIVFRRIYYLANILFKS